MMSVNITNEILLIQSSNVALFCTYFVLHFDNKKRLVH